MENKLVAENLSIRYDKEILSNIDFTFTSGKIYLIQGKSGIGKTSFLNVLGLLRRPSSGNLIYNNNNLWNLSEGGLAEFRSKNIGFIFQDHNLIEGLTVRDNILLPTLKRPDTAINERLHQITEILGITQLLTKFPAELSGGEEQRVAIARALISNVTIILADEPTSSLDADNARKFLELLRSMTVKMNIIAIVVSHESIPENYADITLTIENKKLHMVKQANIISTKKIDSSLTYTSKNSTFRKISFKKALDYDKRLKSKLSITSVILSLLIVFLMSIASLLTALPSFAASQQEDSLSTVIDHSLFAVNDVLSIGASQDLDSYRSFDQKQITTLETLNGVTASYPFLEFVSYGITADNIRSAIPKDQQISLNKKTYSINDPFSIQPIFKEDLSKRYFYLKGKPEKIGTNFVVSQQFLAANNIPYSKVIGKAITLTAYVPYLLYLTNSQDPNNTNKRVAVDGDIYATEQITAKITGVYKQAYPYNRSEQGNGFFMDYSSMKNIQRTIQRRINLNKQIFKDFKQTSWKPSALVLFTNSIDDVQTVTNAINVKEKNVKTYSTLQDLDGARKNIQKTRQETIKVVIATFIAITVTLLVFFILIVRSRTYEIGILKSLGFDNRDVSMILLARSLKLAFRYVISSLTIFALGAFLLSLFKLANPADFLLNAIIVILISGYGATLLANIIPMIVLKKLDPANIINRSRNNS